MGALHFGPADLIETVPPPGWYPTRISSCRWRTSAAGNQMLQVVYGIEGVSAVYARLAEYFVLAEDATSSLAAALAPPGGWRRSTAPRGCPRILATPSRRAIWSGQGWRSRSSPSRGRAGPGFGS